MSESTEVPNESVFGPLYVEITAEKPEFTVVENEAPIHAAAKVFIDLIQQGGSVLTSRDVWTDENLDVLDERFVKQPDVSGADFFAKLDTQIAGVPNDVRILMAELYMLQMLPVRGKAETKILNVEKILQGHNIDYEIPEIINEAFAYPAFAGGQAFLLRRYYQLCVLINFTRFFRAHSRETQQLARANPLQWRQLVRDAPGTAEPTLRASLTYLGHPTYFYGIVSDDHKRSIVDAFFPAVTRVPATGDPDVDLASLQQWMNPRPGAELDFYSSPLREIWQQVESTQAPDDTDPGQHPSTADDVDDVPIAAVYNVESIRKEGSFHSAQALRGILDRWQETNNIVLQGPPGTGKSWLGRRLAYALIGSKIPAAVRAVQFHPGTSYEDFVRGWRPGSDGRLQLADGPLLQHAERARQNKDIPHVLLIEEFNRGNPAQALGEMLTLLETTKRDQAEALELTYMKEGEEPFWLPDNLYVIGTMNTADRSLALVDFALRRRFAFFDLEPQFNDAWLSHLRSHFRELDATAAEAVRDRVMELNERIAADPTLGPSFRIGHSYFTVTRQARDFRSWMKSVIDTSIRPQLAEYWHDSPQEVDAIVERLREGL